MDSRNSFTVLKFTVPSEASEIVQSTTGPFVDCSTLPLLELPHVSDGRHTMYPNLLKRVFIIHSLSIHATGNLAITCSKKLHLLPSYVHLCLPVQNFVLLILG